MVGDSIDDMQAGYRAGATTILLQSPVNSHINDLPETDAVVDSLADIIGLLREGFTTKTKPSDEQLRKFAVIESVNSNSR
jgi:histidinol phosphatase-like enzyme